MYKLIGTNSVKRLADGTYIPFADGNMDYEGYKQWLSEGNISEPEFTDKELNQQRISSIKIKANDLITSKYPSYKQLNIIRNSGKELEIMALEIDRIRAISNEAEIEGIALEDIDWGIQ